MATKSEKLSATKRFGARYGRTVKYKFIEIEREQRKLHKCPYCNRVAVKRMAVGIWFCRKCKSKFTGKAYSVRKKVVPLKVKEKEVSQETPQEPAPLKTMEKQPVAEEN